MMLLSESVVWIKNGIAIIDIETAVKAFDESCAIYRVDGRYSLNQREFGFMDITDSAALALIKKLNLSEFKSRYDRGDSKFFIESRR